tara:strand:+ start:456 stop:764 length:309 start_codon:yes stop_codon:yes gene_type:complete
MSAAELIELIHKNLRVEDYSELYDLMSRVRALDIYLRREERRLEHESRAEQAWEDMCTGAYTPHQYVDGFDEIHNPDHWLMADAGLPHRVVFHFAPLPPPAY